MHDDLTHNGVVHCGVLQDGKEVQDLHSLRQQVTNQHETFVAQDFSTKYARSRSSRDTTHSALSFSFSLVLVVVQRSQRQEARGGLVLRPGQAPQVNLLPRVSLALCVPPLALYTRGRRGQAVSCCARASLLPHTQTTTSSRHLNFLPNFNSFLNYGKM
jgi:hypothetical protein